MEKVTFMYTLPAGDTQFDMEVDDNVVADLRNYENLGDTAKWGVDYFVKTFVCEDAARKGHTNTWNKVTNICAVLANGDIVKNIGKQTIGI